MSFDRFQNESYEDYLCRGKSARECAEIRARLAAQEKRNEELAAERAMAKDPPQPEPRANIGRDLWEIFTSKL